MPWSTGRIERYPVPSRRPWRNRRCRFASTRTLRSEIVQMRSMKSGPGRWRRSLGILGDLKPSRESAFAPRYVSILPPVTLVVAMEFLLALFANSYRKHAAGGGIHQPKQLAFRRLNHLRRQLLRLVRSFQNAFQRERFVRAGDHENYARGVVDGRGGQRDAVGIELAHPVTHRDALGFVQRLGSGKQRSGVAFVAHPEKHEVEARKLALSYLTPSCFTLAYFTVRHFKR